MCVCVCVGLISTVSSCDVSHRCLMISRSDGTCRSFTANDQVSFADLCVCLDPLYDNLWRYIVITAAAAAAAAVRGGRLQCSTSHANCVHFY